MIFDPRHPAGEWEFPPDIRVDAVLRRWQQILSRESPWDAMPLDDITGRMRRVLSELLNESADLDHVARRRRLMRGARDHGEFRAGLGVEEGDQMTEFGLLLVAIEGALREGGMSATAAQDTVAVLESEVWLAEYVARRSLRQSREELRR